MRKNHRKNNINAEQIGKIERNDGKLIATGTVGDELSAISISEQGIKLIYDNKYFLISFEEIYYLAEKKRAF